MKFRFFITIFILLLTLNSSILANSNDSITNSEEFIPVNFITSIDSCLIAIDNSQYKFDSADTLNCGKHIIKIKKIGYENLIDTINVSVENTTFNYTLIEKEYGRLYFPGGNKLNIIINDEKLENYSFVFNETDGIIVDNLDFGKYEVKLSEKYYLDRIDEYEISDEKYFAIVKTKLERMKGNIYLISDGLHINGKIKNKYNKFTFKVAPYDTCIINVPFNDYNIFASSKDCFKTIDEISLFENKIIYPINIHTPNIETARRRSIIFPGFGQLYAKKFSKAFVFSSIYVVSAVNIYKNGTCYIEESDNHRKFKKDYFNSEDLTDTRENYKKLDLSYKDLKKFKKYFYYSLSTFIINYAINIYDIYNYSPPQKFPLNVIEIGLSDINEPQIKLSRMLK